LQVNGFSEGGGDCQALWRQNRMFRALFEVLILRFENGHDKVSSRLIEEE